MMNFGEPTRIEERNPDSPSFLYNFSGEKGYGVQGSNQPSP